MTTETAVFIGLGVVLFIVIIAIIVYLSAFSLVIRMFIMGRKRKVPPKLGVEPAPPPDEQTPDAAEPEKGGEEA